MKVFFVCGAPKSGTTWLQRILDAHPEITCSGEGHFIQRLSAPMAKVVRIYNDGLRIDAEQVYEGRPYYDPIDQAEFDEVMRGMILRRLQARADERTGWIGDKTPAYTRHLDQLHRLFPKAKILHIVRDPREVAVSRIVHSHRAGAPDVLTPGAENYRVTVDGAIAYWMQAVTAVDAFAEAHPGLVHEVRYRDLHADPFGEIEALFGFLGAPAPRVLVEQVVAATSFEALAGRPAGQEDVNAFLRKGVPDDWRSRLDDASAEKIAESCGELMREKRFAA